MNNLRSLADLASAILGISTLCAIAYAAIASIIKRNGGRK